MDSRRIIARPAGYVRKDNQFVSLSSLLSEALLALLLGLLLIFQPIVHGSALRL